MDFLTFDNDSLLDEDNNSIIPQVVINRKMMQPQNVLVYEEIN